MVFLLGTPQALYAIPASPQPSCHVEGTIRSVTRVGERELPVGGSAPEHYAVTLSVSTITPTALPAVESDYTTCVAYRTQLEKSGVKVNLRNYDPSVVRSGNVVAARVYNGGDEWYGGLFITDITLQEGAAVTADGPSDSFLSGGVWLSILIISTVIGAAVFLTAVRWLRVVSSTSHTGGIPARLNVVPQTRPTKEYSAIATLLIAAVLVPLALIVLVLLTDAFPSLPLAIPRDDAVPFLFFFSVFTFSGMWIERLAASFGHVGVVVALLLWVAFILLGDANFFGVALEMYGNAYGFIALPVGYLGGMVGRWWVARAVHRGARTEGHTP